MKQRKIKFRAWDGEKMHYDFTVAGSTFCNCLSIMSDEKFAQETYNVKEWKVMQFTGLKDKCGVEIYEGDELCISEGLPLVGEDPKCPKLSFGSVYRVVFNDGMYKIIKSRHNQGKFLNSVLIRFNGLKVIGNIYNG